jgi:predicted lipid-binding transport protein (Tim44 family)
VEFAGLSVLELLIIGGLVFVIFRVVGGMGRKDDSAGRPMGDDSPKQVPRDDLPPRVQDAAHAAWDRLRSEPEQGAGAESKDDLKGGFDEDEFLKGARAVYTRLQEAWDNRDLDDIANFTSPELLDKLKEQARRKSRKGRTELLLVKAKLMERTEEEGQEKVAVMFDVLLREGGTDQEPEQSREVWHFARSSRERGSTWKLESIEQLET